MVGGRATVHGYRGRQAYGLSHKVFLYVTVCYYYVSTSNNSSYTDKINVGILEYLI
jgi:hypothetical protein